jgi:hypothetical protein
MISSASTNKLASMMITRPFAKSFLMRTRPLSFDQGYPSRIFPLTLKYKEEGKMQVGAFEYEYNLMEMPAPFLG